MINRSKSECSWKFPGDKEIAAITVHFMVNIVVRWDALYKHIQIFYLAITNFLTWNFQACRIKGYLNTLSIGKTEREHQIRLNYRLWAFSFFLLPQIIQKPSHDLKQQLASYSKRVTGSVTELIQAAEAMKGILTFELFNNRMTAEQSHILQGFSSCPSLH